MTIIDRDDFARAIDAFMEELSAICASQTPEGLRLLRGFSEEAQETRTLLADPALTDERLLSLAFGLVDEYYGARREAVLEEAYRYYADRVGGPP
jgi:hypothetical protein